MYAQDLSQAPCHIKMSSRETYVETGPGCVWMSESGVDPLEGDIVEDCGPVDRLVQLQEEHWLQGCAQVQLNTGRGIWQTGIASSIPTGFEESGRLRRRVCI